MNIRHYLIGGVALAAILGTLVYVLSPATITGDREADAACAALAEHLGADGADREAVIGRLPGNRTDQMVAAVTEHTEQSTIPSIRDAGRQLQTAADDRSLFRGLGIMVGAAGVAVACQAAGWTAEKAGMAPRASK